MSDPVSDILIFGAGFGTRMAPLTNDTPKPLIRVANKALIDHAIGLANQAQLTCHVNAHYLAEQMRDHLSDDVTVHVECPDILDTGGGLKNALPHMAGDIVATLNSDAIWSEQNPLDILMSAWKPQMSGLLLTVPIDQTVGYSRSGNFEFTTDSQLLRSESGQVYTGAQLIRKEVVLAHSEPKFSLNTVWDKLIQTGGLYGVSYSGRWADVGTPAGIELAEDMLLANDV